MGCAGYSNWWRKLWGGIPEPSTQAGATPSRQRGPLELELSSSWCRRDFHPRPSPAPSCVAFLPACVFLQLSRTQGVRRPGQDSHRPHPWDPGALPFRSTVPRPGSLIPQKHITRKLLLGKKRANTGADRRHRSGGKLGIQSLVHKAPLWRGGPEGQLPTGAGCSPSESGNPASVFC